jgi:hypothetical protein
MRSKTIEAQAENIWFDKALTSFGADLDPLRTDERRNEGPQVLAKRAADREHASNVMQLA